MASKYQASSLAVTVCEQKYSLFYVMNQVDDIQPRSTLVFLELRRHPAALNERHDYARRALRVVFAAFSYLVVGLVVLDA